MNRVFYPTLLRILALAGLAGMAALVSNQLASPARKLAWTGSKAILPRPAPATPNPAPLALPPEKPKPIISAAPVAARPVAPHLHSPKVESSKPKAEAASTPIREIDSQEAWKAFKSGWPFLDARRSSEFAEGHIAGAWSTPIWESDLEDRLFAFKIARRPSSEDPIVIYCSGGECQDSHLLATKLLNDGYFHLLIYRDGFPDWLAQNHPIQKGRP